jgi:GGDEF domain-containing protein
VNCAEDATFSADNLLAAIAVPHRIEGQDLYVTASVGIGVCPADGTDAETLMRRADRALLRAKARRRAGPPLTTAAAAAAPVAGEAARGLVPGT